MADSQLYEETYLITSIDSKKYDRVSRLTCKSQPSEDTLMTIDVNTELYPCSKDETLQLIVTNTLSLEGGAGDEAKGAAAKGWQDPGRGGEPTLADMYDYVCRGKIYRFEEGEEEGMLKIFISFGGLLMFLHGPWKKLTGLRVDYVYLLMKK